MTLEHVAINHPDPQGAARWYAEHLGLRVVKESSSGLRIHFLADDGGSMLELYSNSAGPTPDYREMSPYTLHFAFASRNVEEDWRRLEAAGAEAVGEIETNPLGDRLGFLRDPWGVPLQIVQRAEPLL